MEYLVYIIIGLYIWEVYLETHWYSCSLYNKYVSFKNTYLLGVKNKLVLWKDFIKAKVKS